MFEIGFTKGGLISEGVLTFGVFGRKFKLSAQESDLPAFVGNWTKVKMTSEIKPPLPI